VRALLAHRIAHVREPASLLQHARASYFNPKLQQSVLRPRKQRVINPDILKSGSQDAFLKYIPNPVSAVAGPATVVVCRREWLRMHVASDVVCLCDAWCGQGYRPNSMLATATSGGLPRPYIDVDPRSGDTSVAPVAPPVASVDLPVPYQRPLLKVSHLSDSFASVS
jgi:hypothetical protein